MVQEKQTESNVVYVCEACGFRYGTRELAEQCETWCKGHNSCNLDITSQGMPPEESL